MKIFKRIKSGGEPNGSTMADGVKQGPGMKDDIEAVQQYISAFVYNHFKIITACIMWQETEHDMYSIPK